MKDILLFYKNKEQELHKKFREVKEMAAEKEEQAAKLHEELIKIQGEFRLLTSLIKEAQKEEDVTVLK